MRYALNALRRRPARTALTAAGIGVAIALLAVLLALSAGINGSAAQLAQSSGVDLLATSANTTLSSGGFPPVPGAHSLPAAMHRADPNVVSASPWLVSSVVFANTSLRAAVNASPNGSAVPGGWGPSGSGAVGWIPAENTGIETPTLLSGPGFVDPNDAHWANGSYTGTSSRSVVIDSELARLLAVGPGAEVWASPTTPAGPSDLAGWFANATSFTVVGVSGPFWLVPSALLSFFYLSDLQQLLAGPATSGDTASVVLIHLHDTSNAGGDASRLAAAFPGLTLFTVGDILGAVQSAVSLYQTFGTLIGAIALLVAFLFTTTVLLMSVDDRSSEIALLRAIGHSPRWVASTVAQEGLLLCGIGLVVGLPLGFVLSSALNNFLRGLLPGLPGSFSFVAFNGGVVAVAIAQALAVGLLACALPVAQTLGRPIAEELRAP
ncbi:MAG: FtsX-like permease family protein [Thermoplasmata archaeon]|nr:FtsX-like permease family protein [Thermoplasmata archaeon]